MNPYFDSLLRLYSANRIGAEQVAIAVTKGWITPDEYEQITGEPYTA